MELLENWGIPYTVTRRKSRSISMRLDETGIRINAGKHIPDDFILNFVNEKKYWIKENWKKYSSVKNSILYLGKEQPAAFLEKINNLENFYRDETRRIIEGLVELHNPDNAFKINKIFIKSQKTRWGSCSIKGNLNFNWKLSMAPPGVIEYVVVHELCHRIEMNHSKKFWKLVEDLCPKYKQHKTWLKNNEFRLSI